MFERLSSEPIYNTRAVVQRTGVPADTFRAWERRYGIPNPIRTSGNQRLYAERDIATIKWLRDQTIAGMTISQAIALFHSQNSSRLKADPSIFHADSHTANGQHLGGGTGPYREIRDELVRSLLLLDGSAADRVVEEALAIINLEDVCLHVLQSALTDIGARWEHGKASVAVEHYASCYVQRKFGALFNQSNPNEGRGPIVAACPEGELHEIGLLLTCLFLSRRSYQILFLGANLPIDDLVLTIDRVQPPLVLLSASREETALKVAQYVRPLKAVVRDKAGRDLPEIGFGGHVFVQRPDLRLDIDGTYLGVDAREVTKNVDRIFALLSV